MPTDISQSVAGLAEPEWTVGITAPPSPPLSSRRLLSSLRRTSTPFGSDIRQKAAVTLNPHRRGGIHHKCHVVEEHQFAMNGPLRLLGAKQGGSPSQRLDNYLHLCVFIPRSHQFCTFTGTTQSNSTGRPDPFGRDSPPQQVKARSAGSSDAGEPGDHENTYTSQLNGG